MGGPGLGDRLLRGGNRGRSALLLDVGTALVDDEAELRPVAEGRRVQLGPAHHPAAVDAREEGAAHGVLQRGPVEPLGGEGRVDGVGLRRVPVLLERPFGPALDQRELHPREGHEIARLHPRVGRFVRVEVAKPLGHQQGLEGGAEGVAQVVEDGPAQTLALDRGHRAELLLHTREGGMEGLGGLGVVDVAVPQGALEDGEHLQPANLTLVGSDAEVDDLGREEAGDEDLLARTGPLHHDGPLGAGLAPGVGGIDRDRVGNRGGGRATVVLARVRLEADLAIARVHHLEDGGGRGAHVGDVDGHGVRQGGDTGVWQPLQRARNKPVSALSATLLPTGSACATVALPAINASGAANATSAGVSSLDPR